MEIELTRIQRLRLALFGRVYLEHRKLPGWTGYNPFYVFKCRKHGIVESKLHGFDELLRCPFCWDEIMTSNPNLFEKTVQEVLGDTT